MLLSQPVPIHGGHRLGPFDCGEETINSWLKERALHNKARGASQTFVICDAETVVGYYCLSAGAMARHEAPKSLQRNMPDPIPVVVLGRFATDLQYQGQGLGKALFRDALQRVVQTANQIGIAAILVQPLHEKVRQFYLRQGFVECPGRATLLCLATGTAAKAIQR